MYIINGIHWDVDTDEDGKKLPTNATILENELLDYVAPARYTCDEDVIDYLTDKHEFCIQGIDSIERI